MGNNYAEKMNDELKNAQEKYIYFLFTLSMAAIAFAVTKSIDMTLSKREIPLGIAVLLWALSILSGISNRLSFMKATVAFITLHLNPNNKYLDKKMNDFSTIASVLFTIQTYTFFLGIISYIIWHILIMKNN